MEIDQGLEAATPRRDDQASELQRALLAQSTALNALTEEIRRDRGRDAPAGTGELEQLRLRFEAVERQQRETPSAAADDRLKAELLSAIKSETQARVRRRVRVWGLWEDERGRGRGVGDGPRLRSFERSPDISTQQP